MHYYIILKHSGIALCHPGAYSRILFDMSDSKMGLLTGDNFLKGTGDNFLKGTRHSL